MSNHFTIYTDGYSSPHKHNRAGHAVYIDRNGTRMGVYNHADDPLFTNNETEVIAIGMGLRHHIALSVAIQHKAKKDSIRAYKWGHEGHISPIGGRSMSVANPPPIRMHSDSMLAIGLVTGTMHTRIKRLLKHVRLARMLWYRAGCPNITWVPRNLNKAGHVI